MSHRHTVPSCCLDQTASIRRPRSDCLDETGARYRRTHTSSETPHRATRGDGGNIVFVDDGTARRVDGEAGDGPIDQRDAQIDWLAGAQRAAASGDAAELVRCARAMPSRAAFLEDDVEVRSIVARALSVAEGDDVFLLEARLISLLPWTDAGLRQTRAAQLVDRVRDHPAPAIRIAAELSYLEAFWAPEHRELRLVHADQAVAMAMLGGLVDAEIEGRLSIRDAPRISPHQRGRR
jgi:hypothetical protein